MRFTSFSFHPCGDSVPESPPPCPASTHILTVDGARPYGGLSGKPAAGSGASSPLGGVRSFSALSRTDFCMNALRFSIQTATHSVPFTSAPRSTNPFGR